MAATQTLTRTKAKTFPVIEIFGPTIQGEGAEAGLPCHFLRLGGCDYRCSWCDTMYAVDPTQVRASSTRLSVDEIVDQLGDLAGTPRWVVISGGNPALHKFGSVIESIRDAGWLVAVETQGSIWRDWLGSVDRLTISPKPPSSRMATPENIAQFDRFMSKALSTAAAATSIIKTVCFDQQDLEFAKATASRYPSLPLYLSAGTPVPTVGNLRDEVGDRYRWLCEAVALDPELGTARVLPQLHVIAWKDATGV